MSAYLEGLRMTTSNLDLDVFDAIADGHSRDGNGILFRTLAEDFEAEGPPIDREKIHAAVRRLIAKGLIEEEFLPFPLSDAPGRTLPILREVSK